MTSLLSAPLGVQEPRYLIAPPSVASSGPEAVELAASVGLHLDPWQARALEVVLGERADGLWSALEAVIEVPRQNGKGSVLEALELAGLFLFGEQLILHSAHEFKTAAEAFRRVVFWIENSDDLRRRVRRVYRSHGDEGIELLTGQRLRFVARSKGSGRGFTADRVIFDEAYNLPGETVAALLPTLSALPNPQLVYTSSAGFGKSHPESDTLWNLHRRARRGVRCDRLALLAWCAADDAGTDDPQALADANPALGFRLSAEFSATERGALTEENYRRERLGIWDGTRKLEDDDESARWSASWPSLLDPSSSPLDPVVVVLDAPPGLESAALGVAGWRDDGLRHVEVVDHRPGSEWVVARTVAVCEGAGVSQVVIPPGSPALSFAKDLEAKGLEVVKPSAAVYGAACGEFVAAVRGGLVRHRSGVFDRVLADAVGSAVRRESGDVFTWSRSSSAVDISPLVAVTLAFHLVPQRVEADRPVFAY